MATHDIGQLVQAAVVLLQAGKRDDARAMLVQALRIDPRHEQATLWLSGTFDSPVEQRQVLQRVLEINPQNQSALRGLALLESQAPPSSPAPYAEAAEPESSETLPLIGLAQAVAPPAAPEPALWTPPEPLDDSQLAEMATECTNCDALVYGNAVFCWRCHRSMHCCDMCAFIQIQECKELQSITDLHAKNTCAWWRPR